MAFSKTAGIGCSKICDGKWIQEWLEIDQKEKIYSNHETNSKIKATIYSEVIRYLLFRGQVLLQLRVKLNAFRG